MWQTEISEIAARQHGVISKEQLRLSAPTKSAARHEVNSARWEQLGDWALRVAGSPATNRQTLMAAVVNAGPGAVVSHDSAAALWELPGFTITPPHVTVLRASPTRTSSDVVIHEVRHLAADQITVLDGIPTTRPERVPFDLANVGLAEGRVERVVDRLWSERLVSGRSLRRVKNSLPKRGFRGTALLRRLLDERGDHWVPPASGLEGRAMELLDRNGFDGYERQVDLGSEEWVGRVDFVNRAKRIVIEVQSERHHAALSSQRDDAARFERLEEAGFCVVAVWEDELWYRPEAFLQRLRRADVGASAA